MKKPSMGTIVALAVIGAFALLITAWCVLFWLASENRVQDVPLEQLPPSAAPVTPNRDAEG